MPISRASSPTAQLGSNIKLDSKVPGDGSSSPRSSTGPPHGETSDLTPQARPPELLSPVTVTGDLEMQAKPWLPDFPSLQLFSGSSGRREDWPPVQAHFPEPRLPSPPQGPSVEITDIWEVLFFFFAWPGCSEKYM